MQAPCLGFPAPHLLWCLFRCLQPAVGGERLLPSLLPSRSGHDVVGGLKVIANQLTCLPVTGPSDDGRVEERRGVEYVPTI